MSRDALLAAPFDALDDAALLAHWRGPRDVHVDLVVDRDECPPERIAGVLEGRFEFNGETHALPDPLPWLDNPSRDVEWHILLHKFYYAPGLGRAFLDSGDERHARRWAQLIDGWIAAVPPGFIAADVTGRRVQNWIYSLRAFADARADRTAPVDPAFFRRLLHALHEQVEYLCAHLTPKRNHRTLELYAIFLAGVALPEMERAAHWRRFALEQTLANMSADLLPDGVHCELSTDYHHLALRNWLNVRTLAERHGVAVPPEMDTLLERALEFSMHVHKPDGLVPSLSDGDVRSFTELLARGAELYDRPDLRYVATGGREGRRPASTVGHFAASGYTVLRSGWGSGAADYADARYLVFDCGPLGEGNHGHFDCLSIELAAHGRSLVVDPGRYTYSEAGDTNWRVRFRGTAVHNTVCVDGLNQTRYEPKAIKEPSRHAQGSVRHKIAGPAPAATLRERVHLPGLDLLHGRAESAAYDAVHERAIVFVDGRYWIVSDRLRAPSRHDYVVNFQLGAHADGAVQAREGGRVDSPGLTLLCAVGGGRRLAVEPGWVSPRYGHKQAAPRVCIAASGHDADFDTVLVPWQAEAPRALLERTAVASADGHSGHALRVWLEAHGMPCIDTWFHADHEADWQLGGLRFRGRWIHLRESVDGMLLRALSHDGASLADGRRELPLACPMEQPA